MQRPKPKERAEKGVGKHSKNKLGIKVDRLRKLEKKDKIILNEVISAVDSMQLSQTKESTKTGMRKPSKTMLDSKVDQLSPKPEIKLEWYTIFVDADSKYSSAVLNGDVNLLKEMVGSQALVRLGGKYPEYGTFCAKISKEVSHKLAGMDEVIDVWPPCMAYFD